MKAASLRGRRVTLRAWTDADLAPFAALNADPEVMRFLPGRLDRAGSDALAARIRANLDRDGHGLWALEVPGLGFAGFVGLAAVPFALALPGVSEAPWEIGWRLARAAWGHGYATEAATLVLGDAFERLGLPQLVSFTAVHNRASAAVMERIELDRRGAFDHPRLAPDHPLCRHLLYAKDRP